MKNNLLFFLLFVGIAIALGNSFVSGHNLNGDFPLYIAQAKSILTGTQEVILEDMRNMIGLSVYQFYSPTLYPWGYPILITPLVWIFGINYTAFKILNAIFFFLALVIIYKNYNLKNNKRLALIIVAFIGYNTSLLLFTNSTTSEMSYFFFSLLSLFLINIYKNQLNKNGLSITCSIALGFVLFFTQQIRTEGLFLTLTLLLIQAFWFIRKSRKLKMIFPLGIPYIVFIVLFVVFTCFFPAGYMEHTKHLRMIEVEKIISNILFYFREVPYSLIPFIRSCGDVGNSFFWIFVFIGMARKPSIYLTETIYTLIIMLFFIFWPHHVTRYFFSINPFLIGFLVLGLDILPNFFKSPYLKTSNIIIINCFVSILLFLLNGVFLNKYNYNSFDMNVEDKTVIEVFDFIKKETKPTDIIACSESRTIYLYTNRLSCNDYGCIEDTKVKVDWYIEFIHRNDYLQYDPEVLCKDSINFPVAFSNNNFLIFKVKK